MKKVLLLMIVALLLVACDHTDLTGEVKLLDDDLSVGNIIPMVLEVPEDLEEIHGIMWLVESDVETEDAFDLIEGEQLLDYYEEIELQSLFETEDLKYDRIALFIPKAPGNYEIIVDGFYKQTNPQGITTLEVEVQ